MAVYLSRGVLGFAALSGLYFGIRDGIFASSLSNNPAIVPPNSEGQEGYHEYANRMAQQLGIHKTIVVMKGNNFGHLGCNLFSYQAGIEIDLEASKEVIFHMIRHELIHIKHHDFLTWTMVPVILAIFTNFILNSRFPISASFIGLGLGIISFAMLRRWTEKRAFLTTIEHASRGENEAARDWVREECSGSPSSFQQSCMSSIEKLFKPSASEIISLYEDKLKLQT
ncbi:MAG: hypothetical protein JSS10_06805 [Verrucomicrobia bacterium]|nr:hypothetical protein [Verrucomicrobiota bacterium]